MSAKTPIKPLKTFIHQSRLTSSTSPSHGIHSQPNITSFEDILNPIKSKRSDCKDGLSSSTIGSYKCLTNKNNRPQSSIQLMEKKEVWPKQKRIDRYLTGSGCITPKGMTVSRSTNEFENREICSLMPQNRYDRMNSKQKMKVSYLRSLPRTNSCSMGYVPSYETTIPTPIYHVLTSYSSVKQIPKKPSFKKIYERSEAKEKQPKKMVSVGVETDLTLTELNAMENAFKSKRREKHSVTPEIDYTQEDQKVCPDVLNRKLERVLKKYQ